MNKKIANEIASMLVAAFVGLFLAAVLLVIGLGDLLRIIERLW